MNTAALSERQLAGALATWTLHGSVPLAEHLVKSGLVNQETASEMQERSSFRLKELSEDAPPDSRGAETGTDSVTKTALDRMDETGRVARLLGISAAMSEVRSHEARQYRSRYQLIRKLGQGGLGTVWLARDMNLQRYVALKEIRKARTASKAALDRFRREAEITSRLEHPGIVPIYQLGEDLESGEAFYAMRFLGKQTLHDAIVEYHERRDEGDNDPMLLRHLLTAFVSVCHAVGHAHSRKVIHRDLKPENIAIDNFGQVIVIDWGLAKVLDDGALEEGFADAACADLGDGERTMAGQVLGSPMYLAPEQAAGRVDEVNEATHIYGLGAILFSILTGEAPHEQSRASSGSTTSRQLFTAISGGPTPRARQANEEVDPALDAVCAKAMARKRYARYPSTTALADDVQRWMAGEPVSAYQEKPSQRIGRWIQNHRRLSQLITAMAIVTLVAVVTLAIAARQNHVAAEQTRFEEMRSDEREVEVHLISAAHGLTGDVRFMSTLPPIQGIIDARGGAVDAEEEKVWRARLETIYEGLLRANPDYLAVTFVSSGTGEAKEVVRVERNSSDQAFIRRVPDSRLSTLESSPLLNAVIELPPGDVRVSTNDTSPANARGYARRRLPAAIPVYDEQSGEPFGMVMIEADLIGRVLGILIGLERHCEIYVTDADGKALVVSSPEFGVEVAAPGVQLARLKPKLSDFFAAGSKERYSSDGATYMTRRVPLDPADVACNLCVVLDLEAHR